MGQEGCTMGRKTEASSTAMLTSVGFFFLLILGIIIVGLTVGYLSTHAPRPQHNHTFHHYLMISRANFYNCQFSASSIQKTFQQDYF
jgi:hypothetical protein